VAGQPTGRIRVNPICVDTNDPMRSTKFGTDGLRIMYNCMNIDVERVRCCTLHHTTLYRLVGAKVNRVPTVSPRIANTGAITTELDRMHVGLYIVNIYYVLCCSNSRAISLLLGHRRSCRMRSAIAALHNGFGFTLDAGSRSGFRSVCTDVPNGPTFLLAAT
jgi:hypothetical protein